MRLVVLVLLLAAAPSVVPFAVPSTVPSTVRSKMPLAAQQSASRWKEIGKTSTGNTVYVDPRSVSKKDSIITATVRVVFAKPSETPQGPITGSRAVAMFNCARGTVAVKENIIWHDERKGKIYVKNVPKIPGFGPVFTSNFSGVALTYLCKAERAG